MSIIACMGWEMLVCLKRSFCGRFVVILWSICGQFVVNYRSRGIRYVTDCPSHPSIHHNKLTTQSMIAILHTEDAEARIIATKRQRPLVSWRRKFNNSTSAGEPLLPDDPSRDDEDATTESGCIRTLLRTKRNRTLISLQQAMLYLNMTAGMLLRASRYLGSAALPIF